MSTAARLRDEQGQVFPVLAVLLVSLVALAFYLFPAGAATILRADAQSAADAAALAAAKGLRTELAARPPGSASVSTGALARVGAERYAAKNGARLTSFRHVGLEVYVGVETRESLGEAGRPVGSEGQKAGARAKARLFPLTSVGGSSLLGASGGGGGGGASGAGACASPAEIEKELSGEIGGIVDLGQRLEGLGIAPSEHPEFGGVDQDAHVEGSYHYRDGALDLNAESCGEAETFDAIAPLLQKAGFGVIWRAPGHNDHLHVDDGGRGGIGAGADLGGVADAFESTYEIRLVPYPGGE